MCDDASLEATLARVAELTEHLLQSVLTRQVDDMFSQASVVGGEDDMKSQQG